MAVKKNLKAKIKAKVAKVKAKVRKNKGKIKKTAAALAVLFLVAGCATADPASRLTKAEYGDLTIKLGEKCCNNTISISISDSALASADSTGSTETQTASPTNTTDVKPDVDVNTTGGKTADVLEAAVSAGVSALTSSSCKDSSCGPCGTCSE